MTLKLTESIIIIHMNMRILYLLTFVLLSSAKLFASNPDSTSVMAADTVRALDEVVVSAKNIRIIKNGISVVPTAREKSSALGGEDLLRRMMIPTLREFEGAFTNSLNEPVTFFIDSIPATADQVAALRGRDVKRVEVLENPSDPRFNGARAVVNYLTVKWEYGGYTNISASQTFVRPEGAYNLFSKFTKGRSMFDFNGSGRWYNYPGDDTWSTERLRFPLKDNPDEVEEIIRKSHTETSGMRNRRVSLGTRWTYTINGTSRLILSGGVTGNNSPGQTDNSTVSYDRPGESDLNSVNFKRSRYISPTFSAIYYNYFKNGSYIYTSAGYNGSMNKSHSLYRLFDLGEVVSEQPNDVRENNHSYTASVSYSLPLRNDKDNLLIQLDGGQTFYRSRYSGTANVRNAMNSSRMFLRGIYYRQLSDTWTSEVELSATEEWSAILGDTTIRSFLPIVYLGASGSIGSKIRLSLSGLVVKNSNSASAYNPVRQQTSEIFGTAGNPNLKNSTTYDLRASYTWTASNSFSLSLSTIYYFEHNCVMQVYLPYDGVMYSTDNTGGNFTNLSFSLSAPLKLMNGRFSINPFVYTRHTHLSGAESTGVISQNLWYGFATLNLYWYPSADWSIGVNGSQNYGRQSQGSNGVCYRNRPRLKLGCEATYTPGNWRLKAAISNINDVDWRIQHWLNTKYYDRTDYGIIRREGFALELSATYTFDYGKRVGRGNESISTGSSISNVR